MYLIIYLFICTLCFASFLQRAEVLNVLFGTVIYTPTYIYMCVCVSIYRERGLYIHTYIYIYTHMYTSCFAVFLQRAEVFTVLFDMIRARVAPPTGDADGSILDSNPKTIHDGGAGDDVFTRTFGTGVRCI